MVVLDTSILIDHLRQPYGTDTLLVKIAQKMAKENVAISVISIQELYEGKSTREKLREDYSLTMLAPFRLLPYTFETAQLAGQVMRDTARSIEFADAAIAATTILYGAELYTLNRKDFAGIENLELWEGGSTT